MPDTVPVTFEVDPETAAALADPATHARIERLIRQTVRPAGIPVARRSDPSAGRHLESAGAPNAGP